MKERQTGPEDNKNNHNLRDTLGATALMVTFLGCLVFLGRISGGDPSASAEPFLFEVSKDNLITGANIGNLINTGVIAAGLIGVAAYLKQSLK